MACDQIVVLSEGRIIANGRHGQCSSPKLSQRVGDIAGASAKIPAQSGYQKRHVQNMKLIRQNLLGKSALEVHDGVKGQ